MNLLSIKSTDSLRFTLCGRMSNLILQAWIETLVVMTYVTSIFTTVFHNIFIKFKTKQSCSSTFATSLNEFRSKSLS